MVHDLAWDEDEWLGALAVIADPPPVLQAIVALDPSWCTRPGLRRLGGVDAAPGQSRYRATRAHLTASISPRNPFPSIGPGIAMPVAPVAQG
ncbi:hypothetical protein [Sinorhizobium meliloti]|uniref:hypothetical protein n=1 Tax=Rhizobium meliloti TaxID=382 RepID=UPI002E0EE408